MKLSEEKEKLKYLLKDTITLLCKNGLSYNETFSIEALIGITLDEGNVLLVNINEKIEPPPNKNKSFDDRPETDNDEDSTEYQEDYTAVKRNRVKRSRKRKLSTGSGHPSDHPITQPSPPKKIHGNENGSEYDNIAIKQEENDSSDLIFIKQESFMEDPAAAQGNIAQPDANMFGSPPPVLPSIQTFPLLLPRPTPSSQAVGGLGANNVPTLGSSPGKHQQTQVINKEICLFIYTLLNVMQIKKITCI